MPSKVLPGTVVATFLWFFLGSAAWCETDAEYRQYIEVGNKLIKENPDSYRGYACRGSAYGYLKKYDLAERDLLKALSLNPSYAGIYAHLASLYFETKRYEKSLFASRKVIELGSEAQESYDCLLANLCKSCLYDECLKKCDEVIAKFPNDASTYFYRAISKNELGTFDKGAVLSDLSKAHLLEPSDAGYKRVYDLARTGKSIHLIKRWNK
ncbi:MAG: hypothetical protein IPP97_23540 [Candidatus Obscuribacter sp.]|nr:hypothetical protein [Candidatus Obscuribacter sp.]